MSKNRGNRRVKLIPLGREGWLNKVPGVIEVLSRDYHFFWSGMCHHTNSVYKTVMGKRDDYRGKMTLYKEEDSYYFVVYCKSHIDVYVLMDGYCNTRGKQSYFIKKWLGRYHQCSDELV